MRWCSKKSGFENLSALSLHSLVAALPSDLHSTNMAMALGAFSALLAPETASFTKLSSSAPSSVSFPSSLRLVAPASSGHATVVRAVASSGASKPETGKREPRGIMKPRRISPEMQALVGVPEIPRTQALKHIWAYIKKHNLQDPEDKKVIVCDDMLKKILGGKDRVGFLEIAGLISPHFL